VVPTVKFYVVVKDHRGSFTIIFQAMGFLLNVECC